MTRSYEWQDIEDGPPPFDLEVIVSVVFPVFTGKKTLFIEWTDPVVTSARRLLPYTCSNRKLIHEVFDCGGKVTHWCHLPSAPD